MKLVKTISNILCRSHGVFSTYLSKACCSFISPTAGDYSCVRQGGTQAAAKIVPALRVVTERATSPRSLKTGVFPARFGVAWQIFVFALAGI